MRAVSLLTMCMTSIKYNSNDRECTCPVQTWDVWHHEPRFTFFFSVVVAQALAQGVAAGAAAHSTGQSSVGIRACERSTGAVGAGRQLGGAAAPGCAAGRLWHRAAPVSPGLQLSLLCIVYHIHIGWRACHQTRFTSEPAAQRLCNVAQQGAACNSH